jgi:stress response protein YsnF
MSNWYVITSRADTVVKEQVAVRQRAEDRTQKIRESARHTEVDVEKDQRPPSDTKKPESGSDPARR